MRKHASLIFIVVMVMIIIVSLALLVVAANAQGLNGHGYLLAAPGAQSPASVDSGRIGWRSG